MSWDRTACGREDSNLHPRGDRDLNPARLPIPPRPRLLQPIDRTGPERSGPARPTVTGIRLPPGYSREVPPAHSSTPSVVPGGPTPSTDTDPADPAGRVRYLTQVMAEIDAEVNRRRVSGDLPAGLEQELDELFLEFSPVGLHGKARLRETLSLVDRSAYVDIAVPVASQKLIGTYVKRLIRKSMGWYIGFIVHQIVKFAWPVARMFHVVVDHVEDLEAAVEAQRTLRCPLRLCPVPIPGRPGGRSRCRCGAHPGSRAGSSTPTAGTGPCWTLLVGAGVDAYGVDPAGAVIEAVVDRGLDVRCRVDRRPPGGGGRRSPVRPGAHRFDPVASPQPAGPPGEPGRFPAGSRRGAGHPFGRPRSRGWSPSSHLLSDLAPGRPLHAETWSHLLADHGFEVARLANSGARTAGSTTWRRPTPRPTGSMPPSMR